VLIALFPLLFAALLGLFLPLLFTDPLKAFLSRHTPLHYLDNQQPIIKKMQPDIRKYTNLDRKTKSFRITCSEKGAGLNYSKCGLTISFVNGSSYKPVEGTLKKSGNELVFTLSSELE